jgi:hypothetical protein
MIEHAVRTFADEVRADWHFPTINAVPRTVNRLSQAYREPPERELLDADGKVIPKSKTEKYDQLKRLYEQFDPNVKFRSMDRFGTVLNTAHFEVVVRGKAIDWDIHLRPKVTVLQHPDNYLDFIKFAYQWGAINPEHETLKEFEGWIYWTEDEHYMIRTDKVKVGLTREDSSNPYRDKDDNGVIPIVTIRKIEQDEYWGRFGADLVHTVELMNLQLGTLYESGLLETHGIPIIKNCKLTSGAIVKLGRRNPIVVDDLTTDDKDPSIEFAKPEPDIEDMMAFCDWLIKEVGATYGLPPSAWALEEKRMSGYAKHLDNMELLEMREDELSMWERAEIDAFEKSRLVYNTWASEWGAKEIDKDMTLKATFPDTKFPESPKEKAERLLAEFQAGINSPVQYFIETEGLTEEEAVKKAIKLAQHNAQVRRAGAGAALKEAIGDEDLPPELLGEEGEE